MLFAIKNLRKERLQGKYGGFVLQVPSFVINQGDKIHLSGPSGSGKSTLLDMLGLVLQPDASEQFTIKLGTDSADVMSIWRKRQMEQLARLRRHMGYVLQTGGLLPYLNARHNIALALKIQGQSNHELIEQVCEQLGIIHLLHKLPAQLSVGERQRVAIARAVVGKPSLILADEPTAALDPAHADRVMAIFTSMATELNLTLFLITHDISQVPHGFRRFAIEHSFNERTTLTQAVLREL